MRDGGGGNISRAGDGIWCGVGTLDGSSDDGLRVYPPVIWLKRQPEEVKWVVKPAPPDKFPV